MGNCAGCGAGCNRSSCRKSCCDCGCDNGPGGGGLLKFSGGVEVLAPGTFTVFLADAGTVDVAPILPNDYPLALPRTVVNFATNLVIGGPLPAGVTAELNLLKNDIEVDGFGIVYTSASPAIQRVDAVGRFLPGDRLELRVRVASPQALANLGFSVTIGLR